MFPNQSHPIIEPQVWRGFNSWGQECARLCQELIVPMRDFIPIIHEQGREIREETVEKRSLEDWHDAEIKRFPGPVAISAVSGR